jgi:hypothetical protein
LVEGAVGVVGVEVCFVCGQYVSQVSFVDDQCAVEEFAAASADPALDVCVGPRGPHRSGQYLDGLGCEDGVEGVGELGVSVPDQKLHSVDAVVQCHEKVTRLLDCPAAGWVGGGAQEVYSAVEMSMVTMQYRRRSSTVSTWKKSTARIPEAWLRRNCAQVGPELGGAGAIPARFRIAHTVEAPTGRPRVPVRR